MPIDATPTVEATTMVRATHESLNLAPLSRGEPAHPLQQTRYVGAAGEAIPTPVIERLERLDDVVFAALSGDADALNEAPARWREALRTISPELLETTRAEYLRRAGTQWNESIRSPAARLTKGFAALEILDLLGE